MQPIPRNPKDPVFVIPSSVVSTLLTASTLSGAFLLIPPDLVTPRIITMFILFVVPVIFWIASLARGARHGYMPCILLSLCIIAHALRATAISPGGHGEMVSKILLVFLAACATVAWTRIPALILAIYITCYLFGSTIVTGIAMMTLADFFIDLALIAILFATTFVGQKIERRSNIPSLPSRSWSKSTKPLDILNSQAFWSDIAMCSDEPVLPETLSMIRTLILTQESRDAYTAGHSVRVMLIASWIAEKMNLPCHRRKLIEAASLFHDIGKIEIDQIVLQKRDPLSFEDRSLIMHHPHFSLSILKRCGAFSNLKDIILYHHTWYCGNEHPDDKIQADIPLEARIVSIADAIDAMASDRPHRSRKNLTEIMDELIREKGSQFDPDATESALKVINRPGFMADLGYHALL